MIAKNRALAYAKEMGLIAKSKLLTFGWSSYSVLVSFIHSINHMNQSCRVTLIKKAFSSVFSNKPVQLQFSFGFEGRQYGNNQIYHSVQIGMVNFLYDNSGVLVDKLVSIFNDSSIRHDYVSYNGHVMPILSVQVSLEREATIDSIAVFAAIHFNQELVGYGVLESVKSGDFDRISQFLTTIKDEALAVVGSQESTPESRA